MSYHVNNTESKANGLGLFGVVQVVLLILKLAGLIQWRWLWVLAPTWVFLGLFVIALMILIAMMLVQDAKEDDS